MNSVDRANKQIDKLMVQNIKMVYPTIAYVFWHEYDWRKNRILKLFDESHDVWEECSGHGVHKSMIQMLDEETGIEIGVPGKKSYKELAYLHSDAWDGKPPTKMQLIYIRKQQAEWIAPSIIACVSLALHRKYGWGAERIGIFVERVKTIRYQRGNNHKNYNKLLDGMGIELNDLTGENNS